VEDNFKLCLSKAFPGTSKGGYAQPVGLVRAFAAQMTGECVDNLLNVDPRFSWCAQEIKLAASKQRCGSDIDYCLRSWARNRRTSELTIGAILSAAHRRGICFNVAGYSRLRIETVRDKQSQLAHTLQTEFFTFDQWVLHDDRLVRGFTDWELGFILGNPNLKMATKFYVLQSGSASLRALSHTELNDLGLLHHPT